jgi:hypothetical protein
MGQRNPAPPNGLLKPQQNNGIDHPSTGAGFRNHPQCWNGFWVPAACQDAMIQDQESVKEAWIDAGSAGWYGIEEIRDPWEPRTPQNSWICWYCSLPLYQLSASSTLLWSFC